MPYIRSESYDFGLLRANHTASKTMGIVRIRYETIEFDDVDIHIRSLRDKQQYADPLGEAEALGISSAQWPLFGVIWESSRVLAREMEYFAFEGKRILELGCGLALSSHLLNFRQADITATDIHPEVGSYLVENVKLNNSVSIPYLRTDWKDSCEGLGKFDVIIGADVLYERDHICLLSNFINQHSKQKAEIILVDPGRKNAAEFSKEMVRLGYSHSQYKSDHIDLNSEKFKGNIMRYLRC